MPQGEKSDINFWNDFTGMISTHVPAAEGDDLGGGVALIGVNEGSYTYLADEPGGVIHITTDTGDNDNHALVAGVFQPAQGGIQMTVRFKLADLAATNAAFWAGFTETLALDTPVMPSKRATATTTYTGSGGMLGVMFDSDSTILELFAVAGDGGAAIATKDKNGTVGDADGIQITGALGVYSSKTILTADRWYIVRVEIAENGKGRIYFGGYDGGASDKQRMELVAENTTALGTTDNFHAVALVENRAGGAEVLEADYFGGHGNRDWSAN
ncbi:MAG: hypothetical protein NUW01_14215 [Gemmatimonadaceae bacterium]|nr:hypothetical protein [Gemmatimonadaceae bacterium]